MMYVPSTDDRGKDLLMWYLEDFLARTLVQQIQPEGVSKESDQGFGPKWPGSLARYDRASHSWRIPHFLPDEVSTLFSEAWPKWGTMHDGECWELTKPEHLISVKGFGLWRTPCSRDHHPSKLSGNPNRQKQIQLAHQVLNPKMWPTPTTNDCKPANKIEVLEYRQKKRRTTVQRLRAAATEPNQIGGSLNPTWVEWLMGWPLGWTDLKPLETDKFRLWLNLHGKF
jgi:hypothetical protein